LRSKLFVPGSRPELLPKAMAGEADALSIDLEDAVAEGRKQYAREQVGLFTRSAAAVEGSKVIIVRVNALSTPHFMPDVQAVVQPGLRMINLPKVETPEEVREAADAIARAEQANGIDPSRRDQGQSIGLLLTIESPKGLRNAAALAAADPRVTGLQIGYGDLLEPLGIVRYDNANVHAIMHAIRYAAAEAGVFAYDGAWADVANAEGFRAEAEMARRLGYLGKSCIHPSQVPLGNSVFRPSDEEIAHARQVLAAAEAADAGGLGAFMVNGRMIDGPFIARARAIVDSADRLGLSLSSPRTP